MQHSVVGAAVWPSRKFFSFLLFVECGKILHQILQNIFFCLVVGASVGSSRKFFSFIFVVYGKFYTKLYTFFYV
jgi:hypothetical protein